MKLSVGKKVAVEAIDVECVEQVMARRAKISCLHHDAPAKLVLHVVLATPNTPAEIDAEAMFAFTVPVFDRVKVSDPEAPTATDP